MLVRIKANRGQSEQIAPSIEPERKLHEAILEECRRRGWYVVHSRMDQPTTTAAGVPDFIIAAEAGRTLWIEVKTKRGKLTTQQEATGVWLRTLGHKHYVVRTIKEFLSL